MSIRCALCAKVGCMWTGMVLYDVKVSGLSM
jgi:hypothetical protein